MPVIILYTKENCSFCNKAKTLLKQKKMSWYEYNVPGQISSNDLKSYLKRTFKVDVKTIPQVVVGEGRKSTYIGGYDELKGYLEENAKKHK